MYDIQPIKCPTSTRAPYTGRKTLNNLVIFSVRVKGHSHFYLSNPLRQRGPAKETSGKPGKGFQGNTERYCSYSHYGFLLFESTLIV